MYWPEHDACETVEVARTMSHEQVSTEVRDRRRQFGQTMSTSEIAELAGVAVQTLKQYSQFPGSRGARLMPGERLDRLRNRAALAHVLHWSRAQIPFQPCSERQWLVCTTDGDVILDVTFEQYAHSYAARHGGICIPGAENSGRSSMTADDWLRVEWLDVRHCGHVTKADAMAVTGTDEWTEGMVAFEASSRPIVPTRSEIEALREIAESRSLSHEA